MRISLVSLAAAVFAIAAAPPAVAQPPPSPLLSKRPVSERPELMVLGVVHLANPHHDVHNADVDDMLAPARQAQIERLVDALAAWKPTHVAIEWPRSAQAKLDQRYADFRAGKFKLTANEDDQIGLRLAAKLNLPRVDAVDWNDDAPGPDAAYDWQAGAKLANEEARLAAISDKAIDQEETRLVRTHTVAGFLRILNKPAALDELNQAYYDIALLGTPETNPGANWVGAWYARNLRIFDNLIWLNAKPDARILAIYGAGHGHFLNLFAQDSHAFRLARPDAVLAQAEKRR